MRSIRFGFTLLSLVSLAAFVGCASAPVPNTYYLLRAAPVGQVGPIEPTIRAGLGRVVVAPYLLSSKGIMVETGTGEINPALHAQWAEPLDAGLRWYLQTQIANELGQDISGGLTNRSRWDYTIDVVVSQLHGTMSGTALIEAEFVITPNDASRAISEVRFAKTIPLPEAGYPGVVEAEKQLAKELARLIADELEVQSAR